MNNGDYEINDYCYILFQQCYYTCRLYNQEPFKVEVFPPDDRRKTFLMFKCSPRGTISTKKMTVLNKDSDRFKDYLLDAYPNLIISELAPPNPEDSETA